MASNPIHTKPMPPTENEHELLHRARTLAGATLGTIASRQGKTVPEDLRRHKGWVGELIETALDAASGSLPQPDFPELGIELKTLPIRPDGRPGESTHICTVPLTDNIGLTWRNSLVRRKLQRVLWVPIESDSAVPLPERRIGTALLWSPNPQEDAVLERDWEELMELVCLGAFDQLTAHRGEYLQIRPKAANGRALTPGINASGQPILTLPRGFYLRSSFTEQVLRENYLMPS